MYLGFMWSSAYGCSSFNLYEGDLVKVWNEFVDNESITSMFDLDVDESIINKYFDSNDSNEKFIYKVNKIKEDLCNDGFTNDPFVDYYYYLIKFENKINLNKIGYICIPNEYVSNTVLDFNKIKLCTKLYDNDKLHEKYVIAVNEDFKTPLSSL
jgi:hypothetical protein